MTISHASYTQLQNNM